MHILKQKLMAVTKYIPPARVVPPGAYPSQTQKVQEVANIHPTHPFSDMVFLIISLLPSCHEDQLFPELYIMCTLHGQKTLVMYDW